MIFLEQLLPVLISILITVVPIAIVIWFFLKILKNQKEQAILLKDIVKKLDAGKKTNT
ncbi:hypothetical protein NLX67_15375 [Domibacillus sp. A3M-37]|uniref:hypothetical protein n=1 Tax=Domibacillus sp. A3M-37 TaxID=2962037 RepID=UPI0020B765CC|nr:hypothetical protein [Domibacillus sp. A3M-37]MCP3763755.1 hypothetical protein [Domibacillus sp. A3M-37]